MFEQITPAIDGDSNSGITEIPIPDLEIPDFDFSKKARGNHRADDLRDLSDEDIAAEVSGLSGRLTKEQKARKRKLVSEQKFRTRRNAQKKGSEKNTGTGRRN